MIKTFPTLYARTSTGAVQVWWMEQDGDKYRSTSGQKDGQKIVSDWTVATPKNVGRANATSAEDQAWNEIESKYKKQLKTGYYKNESDIDKPPFFEVMLAKNYGDYKDEIDWSQGVAVQIKYNGGRVVAKADGLWTRKGEQYLSIPHIHEALKPFFVKFPNAVLDGEGFNYENREKLNEIMKLLRRTVHITPQHLQRSKDLIKFYIYDGFGFPFEKDGVIVGANDDYLLRKKAIDNAFFADCFKERYKDIVGYVPTWIVKSEKELQSKFLEVLGDKQEGLILRILRKPYEHKRSRYLLKYKPVDDAEYRVVAVLEGVGKFAGRVATFVCEKVDGSKFQDGETTFKATFKGTEEEAIEAWIKGTAKKLIGGVWTIEFNGYTGFGKPNYARLDWNNYDKGHK